MPRRGYSTTIGKIAKVHRDRRASEIRLLGEALRREQRAASGDGTPAREMRHETRGRPWSSYRVAPGTGDAA